jgi:hypothetical protein
MKKIFLLALVLFLSISSVVLAHDDTNNKSTNDTNYERGYIGFAGGLDLITSSWNAAGVTYGSGGLADVFGGLQLDKSLSFQAEVENFIAEGTYATNIISQYNLRGLIAVKYAFDVPVIEPYLLVGGGLVYSLLNQQVNVYTTSVNADALGGLGLQLQLSSASYLFVEGRYNLILSSNTSLSDIPITAGIWTAF